MKHLNGFLAGFVLLAGVCAWVSFARTSVVAQAAQQSAATAPPPAAKDADIPPAKTNSAQQSFTVMAETPEDEGPVLVLHNTTRRVVVDVVVTGPDGKPLHGLKQQDFQVSEDRKPQPIRAFEVHSPEEDQSLLPAPPALPSHVFLNLEQTPASGPLVVVLIDYLNTRVTDQAYAHEQIVRFLEKKPASMEVAILTLSDQLTLLQGFTTDTGKLLATMRSRAAGMHMAASSENLMRAQITLDAFQDIGRFLATQAGRKNLLWFSESFDMMVLPNSRDAESGSMTINNDPGRASPGPGVTTTSASLESLTANIGLSNDSSSAGFNLDSGDMIVLREEMRKVATALAVSQTAVYPIDVRGLTVDPGMTASASTAANASTSVGPQGQVGTPGAPTQPGSLPTNLQSHVDFMQSLEATQATMGEIADATGGRAFMNTNGLTASASQAVTEGSSYYTLVYAPTNPNFDGGLRSIHVTLDRPGCKLAYRSAYFAVDPATVTPEDVHTGAMAALMVRGAPQAQGLVFKAEINPDGVPVMAAPDSPLAAKALYHSAKKHNKLQQLSGTVQKYDIRMAILTPQMQFTASADGRHHAALEIAIYAFAADGQKLGGIKQNLQASMPPKVYQDALQNGMFHNLKVDLPVEATSMRLAILDSVSHRAGSLEVALPLPPVEAAQTAKP
ncbi:MAG: VWA domain-containing protein [Terracidiphilus sp.]